MLDKLIVKKRIYTEPYAQCLACHYGETLPMRRGKLDGHKIGDEIFYGKFKQDSRGNVYHNCGQDVWRLCELFTDFRRV